MRNLILILFVIYVGSCTCQNHDKVYNLLTNQGTYKSWDYLNDNMSNEGGIIFSKDSTYSFYYTYYNDSIKIINKGGLHGYINKWNYKGDSLYINSTENEMKIIYVSNDTLKIKLNSKNNKDTFIYIASKSQEMPISIDSFKKLKINIPTSPRYYHKNQINK